MRKSFRFVLLKSHGAHLCVAILYAAARSRDLISSNGDSGSVHALLANFGDSLSSSTVGLDFSPVGLLCAWSLFASPRTVMVVEGNPSAKSRER
jgi:hypothetical protein